MMKKIKEWVYGIKADKLLHFICGMVIAQVAYGLLVLCCIPLMAWFFGLAAAVVAASLKEWWDFGHQGVPSWKDFIATVIGAIVGLLIMLI